MAVIVVDPFSDVAGNDLNTHAAQVGGTWLRNSAAASTMPMLFTTSPANYVRNSSAAIGMYYSPATPPSADYYVQADFLYNGTASNGQMGVSLRSSTSAVTCYTFLFQFSNNQWRLYKNVAGVATVIGTSVGVSWTSGTTYRLKIKASGTTITGYVNDVATISATDSSIATTGQAGLYGNGTGNGTDTSGALGRNFWSADLTTPYASPLTITSITGSGATLAAQGSQEGTAPYTFQYQRAPDSSGVPGAWANIGSAQSGIAAGVAPASYTDSSGSASTIYDYRVTVTDSAGMPVTANGQYSTITTSALVNITSATPSPINTSSTTTVTFVGQNTHWTTTAPTISLANVGGIYTAGTVTVVDATHVTVPITTNGTAGSFIATLTNVTDGALTAPSVTVSVGSVIIACNNAAFYYSGGSGASWFVNGSTYAQTNIQGNYFKINFSGTSCTMAVDVSTLIAVSAIGTNYPRLAWIVDNGALQTASLTSASTTVTLATGLANTTHTLKLMLMGNGGSSDVWNTPSLVFRFTSLTIDAGASVSAPTLQPNGTWWAYGDSTTAGNSVLGSGFSTTSTSDGTQTYSTRASDALGFEYTPIAYGGQGWRTNGASGSNVPPIYTVGNPALSAWDKLDGAGHSRSFATPPTIITIQHGRNDVSGSVSDANVTAAVTPFLTALRAAVGSSTKIILLVSADGSKRAAVLAGFTAYATTYSTNASGNGGTWYKMAGEQTYLFDLGTTMQNGLNGSTASYATFDGIHPNVWKHAEEASRFVQLYQASQGVNSMAVISFPVGILYDDSGAALTAPVVTVASVTDVSGGTIASPGVTVNGSGTSTPISYTYDAEAKGEAWITLAVSQAGRTVTGANAAPPFFAARDSSRVVTGFSGTGQLAANAIDFAQMTAALKALLLRDRMTLTGVTTAPVTADTYFVAGLYNNGTNTLPYYQSSALAPGLYIWSNGTVWNITTTAPGVTLPAGYFQTASGATAVGPYTAQGTATGTTVVTPAGNAILSGYQPNNPVLATAFDSMFISGTVVSVTDATHFTGNAGLSSVDNAYQNCELVFGLASANPGLAHKISSYVGSTKGFVIPAFPTLPVVGDSFRIVGRIE